MTDTRGVVKEAVEWSKGNNTLLGDTMDGFEIKRRGTVRASEPHWWHAYLRFDDRRSCCVAF